MTDTLYIKEQNPAYRPSVFFLKLSKYAKKARIFAKLLKQQLTKIRAYIFCKNKSK